ncbi:MAG TPA: F0F1 ATP synthase subunit delta [Patescibacteria group bacterium]
MADLGPYADALATVATDQAAAWRELAALSEAVSREPELKRGLIDAAARREPARGKRLAKLLKPVSAPVAKLVALLLAEGAIDRLSELVDVLARRLSKRGYVRVHLESADPLPDTEVRTVLRALKVAPAKALVTSETDPSLIAGIRAAVDGQVRDATLGGRLDRVAEALTGANA